MKKSLVMASLVVASTSMMAMDLQYFLGAGVERGDMNGKYSLNVSNGYSENDSISDDASDLKLKLGMILNKTHRISLSHINYGIDDGGDFRIILTGTSLSSFLIKVPSGVSTLISVSVALFILKLYSSFILFYFYVVLWKFKR